MTDFLDFKEATSLIKDTHSLIKDVPSLIKDATSLIKDTVSLLAKIIKKTPHLIRMNPHLLRMCPQLLLRMHTHTSLRTHPHSYLLKAFGIVVCETPKILLLKNENEKKSVVITLINICWSKEKI